MSTADRPPTRFDQANPIHRGIRVLAGTRAVGRILAAVLHHLDGPVLRRSGGRHSLTSIITGLPIVELTTIGARTGAPRTLPIIAVPDADRLVLIASNFGQQRNPGWYYNLKANPDCSVVKRGQRRDVQAYEAEGFERERLWRLDLTVYPSRIRYQQRARNRRLPVMVLQPMQPSPSHGGPSEHQP